MSFKISNTIIILISIITSTYLIPINFILILICFIPILIIFILLFNLILSWYIDELIRSKVNNNKKEKQDNSSRNLSSSTSTSINNKYRIIPPFKFTTPSAWSMTQTRHNWSSTSQSTQLHSSFFPPSTSSTSNSILLSNSLQSLFSLIISDFILKWYTPLSSSSHSFPNVIEKNLLFSLKLLGERILLVDWSEVIVGKILPLITEHIELFNRAEFELRRGGGMMDDNIIEGGGGGTPLRGGKSSRKKLTPLTESPELSLFLSSKYATLTLKGKLHSAVDTTSPNSKPKEELWLRNLIELILPLVMNPIELKSPVVGISTREILSCTILSNVIESVCDEDFWNKLIDEKAGAAIRDQKMVSQFREALDAQNVIISSSSTHPTTTTTTTTSSKPNNQKSTSNNNNNNNKRTEEISVKTSVKQFELFVKGIGKCINLLEVRRLRSDVVSQIRKTLLLVDGKTKDEIVEGQKVSDLTNYIERLYVAQKKADKRIEELGGVYESNTRLNLNPLDTTTSHPNITLRDILLSPTSLSYFMEFQDRRNRSLRVQFWLLVEGLKDPLEDLELDDFETNQSISAGGVGIGLNKKLPLPQNSRIESTKEDMKMIWDTYFITNVLNSNLKYIKIVKDFLELENNQIMITTEHLIKVKRAVFGAQNDVLKEMEEEDFPTFSKSDLYFKALINIPVPLTSTTIQQTMSPTTILPNISSPLQNRSRTNTTTATNINSLPPTPPLPYHSIFQRTTTSPLPSSSSSTTTTTTTLINSKPNLLNLNSTSIIPSLFQSQSQRNETLPPQISFQSSVSTGTTTTSGSSGNGLNNMSRKSSVASMDGLGLLSTTTSVGAAGIGGGNRKRLIPISSNSLNFLMSNNSILGGGGEGEGSELIKDGTRSPLFVEEEEEEVFKGFESREQEEFGEEGEEEDYIQVQTIEAIQEALNSILATDAKSVLQSQSRKLTGGGGGSGSGGNGSLSNSQELLIEEGINHSRSSSAIGRQFSISDPNGLKKPLTSGSNLTSRSVTPTLLNGGLNSTSSLAFTKTSTSINSNPQDEITTPRKPKRVFDDYEDLEESDSEEGDLEEVFDPIKEIKLAAPGDLHLSIEINRIGKLIEKLKSQQVVVGALIRKAELTGISSELKILLKSRESLKREIKVLEFQKIQFESQDSQNQLLPERTLVTISGTTIGHQPNGQSFQLYLVQVHQLASDGSSGWIVTRRYSEFATLHASLKEKFLGIKLLDLPSKRLVTSHSEGFIEQRRIGLEKFLQALVKIEVICQSNELRSFLSQQNISLPNLETIDPITKQTISTSNNVTLFPGQSLVRSFYRSVTSGLDDMFTGGPSSMMEIIISRLLISQQTELNNNNSSSNNNNFNNSILGKGNVQEEDLVGLIANTSITGAGAGAKNSIGLVGDEGLSYFTTPICDFFITLFDLKEKNNWLRRQAIVIILQQVLGGTIERKFRDSVKMVMGQDQLIIYIELLKNGLWPNGELKPKELPRTNEERVQTRDSANRKLSALMPDVAANLIGRSNARQGARRLFAVLQNRRLNKHLLYSIIDEVVAALFPELEKEKKDQL